jgi:hypothetical protein
MQAFLWMGLPSMVAGTMQVPHMPVASTSAMPRPMPGGTGREHALEWRRDEPLDAERPVVRV